VRGELRSGLIPHSASTPRRGKLPTLTQRKSRVNACRPQKIDVFRLSPLSFSSGNACSVCSRALLDQTARPAIGSMTTDSRLRTVARAHLAHKCSVISLQAPENKAPSVVPALISRISGYCLESLRERSSRNSENERTAGWLS
jgi:hypothetical protein